MAAPAHAEVVNPYHYDASKDQLPAGYGYLLPPQDVKTAWSILGDQSQILHVSLTDKIDRKIRTLGGFFSNVGTVVGGESIFKWQYTNTSHQNTFVGVCSKIPGNLIPINMSQYPDGIRAKRSSWVVSIGEDVAISAKFTLRGNVSCLAMCCGVGPFFQTIKGGSWSFLSAYGTVVTKELAQGEVIICDEDAFVACSTTVSIDVRMAGGCKTVVAGGEGLFNLKVTGPGLVILESLSFRRLRKLFGPPDAKPSKKKEGASA